MTFVINYERQIAASAEKVWQVLADLPAYPQWNPFVLHCESSLQVDTPIVMRVRLLPWLTLQQKETVRVCRDNEMLEYGVQIPGLLRSARQHVLVSLDENHTRYESRFMLRGLLAPLVGSLLGKALKTGFAAMTDAVVARAENRVR